MATYLITGGAGFIGTNLTIALLAEGHTVKVFDNFAGGKFEDRIQSGADYIEGDIRDKEAVKAALVGVDGIFHMAALPRVGYSVEHPELTHDVNVNGTLAVLQAAKEVGVKRVVFSSSSSSYGDQEVFPLKEDGTVKMPIAPYALHKFIGEQYCRLFADLYGVQTVSLIYFNVYGPYADPNGAHALVIGKFLKQKAEGEAMTIFGDGEYFRDYTYIDDVVRANILAMITSDIGTGETINIGNKNPRSVNDIAKIIGGETVYVDARAGDGRYFEADITKAKELLGWEPSMELEEGIAKLKAHMGLV